ncbi:DUF4352 domain-containing protein [Streptomyces boluensis]|uniref:DUF4352 domain-containing protein n=1 Tax=Streptomyces boluensis TaxID=1775135 RepID=A0A964UVF5_9ACTN|nr:DUF4352 domain-containing protein [Streptomyces boluensis]NBE55246.1 hypothetical protein [Streptomyces boluensis]
MRWIRATVAARLPVAAAMTACLLGVSAGTVTAAAAPAKDVAAWGETLEWDDGLAVTASQPVRFTPSDTSIGHDPGNQAVKWKIKVHNGTDEPFKAILMTVNVKSGADGETCEQIFDGKLGGGITGTVSPGSSGTAEFAFDVPSDQLNTVDLEVTPGLDYDGMHWVGAVK